MNVNFDLLQMSSILSCLLFGSFHFGLVWRCTILLPPYLSSSSTSSLSIPTSFLHLFFTSHTIFRPFTYSCRCYKQKKIEVAMFKSLHFPLFKNGAWTSILSGWNGRVEFNVDWQNMSNTYKEELVISYLAKELSSAHFVWPCGQAFIFV